MQEGRVTEVAVPHITSSGLIYVQLHKSVLVCLQDKVSLLQPNKISKGSVNQPAKGVMYLAPFIDGCWYRAVIQGVEDGEEKVLQIVNNIIIIMCKLEF